MKMKNLFLPLLLTALPAGAADSRIPMLVQGKSWHYVYHHFEEKAEPTGNDYPEDFFDESTYMVSYTLSGDTVIGGRQYMKLYRSAERDGKAVYYGALREDADGLVWQWDLMGDSHDFMLCDPTCSAYPGEDNMAIAQTISVNGRLLHRYLWNSFIGVEGVGIEGKGLVHYLYGESPDCVCDYETFEGVEGGGIWFTATDFRAPKHIELTQAEQEMLHNSNAFAITLFEKARGKESCVLSPLSVSYALGMLNNGAAGQTRQEICSVLGFADAEGQNEFCRKMMNELHTMTFADAKALISNTIFVNQGMGWQLSPEFEHLAHEYYLAWPENRDFADGETLGAINKWGSDHTGGMIREVLSEQEFSAQEVSYLLNAIYFKGGWSCPFNAEATKDEPFNGGHPVPMMHQEHAELEYAENEVWQTVTLPYGNGSYRMQVFLPREGKTIADVLSSLSADPSPLTARHPKYEVNLKLPRFSTGTSVYLQPIMSELGMPTAFSPYGADFSRLCTDMHGERIYIGMMKQVAKIEVGEEGTEAAAVTIIVEEPTAAMPEEATFHADRPFLYVISEQSTGLILFMGQYAGEGTTDGIAHHAASPASVEGDLQSPRRGIYSLSGQRLQAPPAKGLYIEEGRITSP